MLVYRPQKKTIADQTAFLSQLLTAVSAMSSSMLLGDLNVPVDSSSSPFATEFLALLDCLDVTQHARGPTHNKGQTLDLVCSTGTPPTNLQCLDLAASDHHTIAFSVPGSLPRQHLKCTITSRNMKTVSAPALSTLIDSNMAGVSPDLSADDLWQ